jgi:hypothetical protein
MNSHYIIVGSGPSGAMAAQTLVEAGMDVLMLDVGDKDEKYQQLVADTDFITIRQTDNNQHRFFLGDDFEAMPWEDIKVGAQLSPSRKAMIKSINKLTPLVSDTFLPMESLGYGGLGAGWGLGAYVYSSGELIKSGLDPLEMNPAYQTITDRIGISIGDSEIRRYLVGDIKNTQPPLKMDNSVNKMNEAYQKKKHFFEKNHILFGPPSMAILTRDLRDRKAISYHDMEFYNDLGKSAYRSWFTIEAMKSKPNFKYINKQLVVKFLEKEGNTIVVTKNIETGEESEFYCKKLILTASPLGTARIVIRSLQGKIKRLPILCNPYTYMPCIHLKMLGKPLDRYKTSMAQAMMIYDVTGKHDDLVSLAIYTYRSLMLFKLIKEAPLNFSDGRKIMQFLQSSFVIAGIFHPDSYTEEKYLELHADPASFTGDHLFAHYKLSGYELKTIKDREAVLRKAFKKLGCFPIKRMDPGYGASIHYAGTLPYDDSGKMGTLAKSGKLNGFGNVYVADGSGFRYLPAKGITLSLMANAHRTAMNSL